MKAQPRQLLVPFCPHCCWHPEALLARLRQGELYNRLPDISLRRGEWQSCPVLLLGVGASGGTGGGSCKTCGGGGIRAGGGGRGGPGGGEDGGGVGGGG